MNEFAVNNNSFHMIARKKTLELKTFGIPTISTRDNEEKVVLGTYKIEGISMGYAFLL